MDKYNVARYQMIYIYAIDDEKHKGLLKIGTTSFNSLKSISQLTINCSELNQAAHKRINEQTKTSMVEYELLHAELAVKEIIMNDGSSQWITFNDFVVREVILNSGFNIRSFKDTDRLSEWYEIDLDSAKKAIAAVKENRNTINSSQTIELNQNESKVIELRNEQEACVQKTIDWFKKGSEFLWDCKMRFGKTLTAYELIRRMNEKGKFFKTIVVTHRPAVEDSWRSEHHVVFKNNDQSTFLSKTNGKNVIEGPIDGKNDSILKEVASSNKPFVYFASMQDLRESKIVKVDGIDKNNAVFAMDWDLIIIDEAHEGIETRHGREVTDNLKKANTKVLRLTGTPYNIVEKYESNKFTWTYVDEQKAKANWNLDFPNIQNPYQDLPKMNILTFDLSNCIDNSYRYVSESVAFNFNEFFRTWTGDVQKDYREMPNESSVGKFVHEADVYKFLSLISEEDPDSNYPFSTDVYRDMFRHTFWIVPGVAAARALSAMLKKHPRFHDYSIVNIAGEGDVEQPYDKALDLVRSHIASYDKTITISCGKLTTGVTVKQWTGVMMLSGSSSTSASGYMQAIFRVQSPGYINGKRKENCYVFDFAPDRALKVLSSIHSLNEKSKSGEQDQRAILGEFINFCPVISAEQTVMKAYDVDAMMRQLKRISVDKAIESGFDDDTIYKSNIIKNFDDRDEAIVMQLSDVLVPQSKRKREHKLIINNQGMNEEERQKAEVALKKPKKQLTPEEKELIEKLKAEREEEKKLFDLLRAVSIRLPLLFYGADADINEIIHLKDFVKIVDDESWTEFMPARLSKKLFLDILKYYDEDVIVGAGMRIRKMSKAADELLPTLRVKRIIEIISRFKNPDKETVLTPWRVVNMHLADTIGGYSFYHNNYTEELDEPVFVDQGRATTEIFKNPNTKILELNSKSGLYPLYLAYTLYMIQTKGNKEIKFDDAQKIWFDIVEKHIYVLCKTPMAEKITRRTLVGYSNTKVNTKYLPHLIDEWMKDIPRLAKKLKNPKTWNQEGETMEFSSVVGNPPYQGTHHNQLYPFFYKLSIITAYWVTLIFPTGWQQPKNSNNLKLLNTPEIKEDKQIVKLNNCQNVFPGIAGAQWVNIILWNKNYDNVLDGEQWIYTNGLDPIKTKLSYDESEIKKPNEIIKLYKCILESKDFKSLQGEMSTSKPYGIRSDVFENYDWKYNLPTLNKKRNNSDDIVIYGSSNEVRYVPKFYPFPRTTKAFKKWKVLVGHAWGNMSERAGLGGAYANIVIAGPNEACTETYQESGCFDSFHLAQKHAKYLMTKFARACLYIFKSSQNTTQSWGAVPVQTYEEKWWNESIEVINMKLMQKYKLPQNVIDFINENIQIKDESNIVNFNIKNKKQLS